MLTAVSSLAAHRHPGGRNYDPTPRVACPLENRLEGTAGVPRYGGRSLPHDSDKLVYSGHFCHRCARGGSNRLRCELSVLPKKKKAQDSAAAASTLRVGLFPFAKGDQIPGSVGRRSRLSEDIKIPVIGPELVKDAARLIPLVQHVLHPILFSFEPELYGSLVRLSARIAFHVHLHNFIVSQTKAAGHLRFSQKSNQPSGRPVAEGSPELMPESTMDGREGHRSMPLPRSLDSPNCLPV